MATTRAERLRTLVEAWAAEGRALAAALRRSGMAREAEAVARAAETAAQGPLRAA